MRKLYVSVNVEGSIAFVTSYGLKCFAPLQLSWNGVLHIFETGSVTSTV
jgi:hypothetical protein